MAAQPITDRTGPVRLPGLALNRDIAAGEHVEKEIDQFIERRHRDRVATEGERQAERLSGVLASLVAHHEVEAQRHHDDEGSAA